MKTALPYLKLPALLGISTIFSAESATWEPLYAGTQLALYSTNVKPGHVSVQPFVSYTYFNGSYNPHWKHIANPQQSETAYLMSLEAGVTSWLDINLLFSQANRTYKSRHTFSWTDTTLYLGIQCLRDQKNDWTPDLRLLIGETFPTGRYDRLKPRKKGSDIFGSGAYVTSLVLIAAKTFYTFTTHPYNLNLNIYYNLSSSLKAHALSLYGLAPSQGAIVKPGHEWTINIAFQYSLNQVWALGTDIRYSYQAATQSRVPSLKSGVSEQISLAPCLEYSWTEDFNAAAGFWFTMAGKNTSSFIGILGNIYCYF
jgi:hypothetical protein